MPATSNPRSSGAAAPQQARAGTFGERLRREREMRGIKLEEIAESTKIGKRNLQALEDEHFDQLPGGIFNKGFVRAYAKFLGLDEEQAVNDFLAASANYDQPEALQPLAAIASARASAAIPSDRELRRKERIWALAALLVLILAGILYWRWKSAGKPIFFEHVHAATNIAPARVVPEPAPPATDTSAAPQPSQVNQAPAMPTQNAPPPSASAHDTNTSVSKAPAQSSTDGISLVIHAKEESWISVTADGQPVLNSVLAAGESRQVRADRELILKTGNAGGLDVSFNGQPLPALGAEKQVKTLTFSADGLH